MKFCYWFGFLFVLSTDLTYAEIYKSTDAEGHVSYSSTASKGAKRLGLAPLHPPKRAKKKHSSRRSANSHKSSTPKDFPRVSSGMQRNRDGIRYRILADELATEETLLTKARKNLRKADAAKAGTQQKEVTRHEKNVSALKIELSHLK